MLCVLIFFYKAPNNLQNRLYKNGITCQDMADVDNLNVSGINIE